MKLARILYEHLMQEVELSAGPAFRSLKCRCLDGGWCKLPQQWMEGLWREAVAPVRAVSSKISLVIVKKLQEGDKWKTSTCQTWSASSSLLILFQCKVRYEYLLFEYASGGTEPLWWVLPLIARLAEPCELAPSVFLTLPLEGELGKRCKYSFLSA